MNASRYGRLEHNCAVRMANIGLPYFGVECHSPRTWTSQATSQSTIWEMSKSRLPDGSKSGARPLSKKRRSIHRYRLVSPKNGGANPLQDLETPGVNPPANPGSARGRWQLIGEWVLLGLLATGY